MVHSILTHIQHLVQQTILMTTLMSRQYTIIHTYLYRHRSRGFVFRNRTHGYNIDCLFDTCYRYVRLDYSLLLGKNPGTQAQKARVSYAKVS